MSNIDPRLIESASLTAIGQVRASNQDYCDEFHSPTGRRLLVVADGMGGHRGGATASRVATETIGESFERSTANSHDSLEDALTAANRCVHSQSLDNPELRGMGTTVVALLFETDGRIWVAHVGDSRVYHLKATSIEQITEDHSVVGEMVRRGLITPEEAEVHPRKNEILRSVGVEADVEIDIAEVMAAPGDRFVLCSDGLSGLVMEPEIAEIVRSHPPQAAAKQLVALANDRGGHDNITVQIAILPAAESQPLGSGGEESEAAQLATSPIPVFAWLADHWIAGLGVTFVVVLIAYFATCGLNSKAEATAPDATSETQAPMPPTRGEELEP